MNEQKETNLHHAIKILKDEYSLLSQTDQFNDEIQSIVLALIILEKLDEKGF